MGLEVGRMSIAYECTMSDKRVFRGTGGGGGWLPHGGVEQQSANGGQGVEAEADFLFHSG